MIIKGLTKEDVTTRNTAAKADEMRMARDRALRDSDFSMLEDSPKDKNAWKSYRQQLRDATKAKEWPYIELPEAPQ